MRNNLKKGNFFLNNIYLFTAIIFFCLYYMEILLKPIFIEDYFHKGEFLLHLPNILNGQISYTIHGGYDYILSYIFYKVFGVDNYFFHTVFGLKFLSFISNLLFIVLLYSLKVLKKSSGLVLIITVLLTRFSFFNARDIFLLLSMIIIVLDHNSKHRYKSLLILLGVFICLNLIWSFDRGIAGSATFFILSIFYLKRDKLYVLVYVSFIITLAFMHFFLKGFNFIVMLENIIFLIKTSENWNYDFHIKVFINQVILVGSYITLLIISFKKRKFFIDNKDYIFLSLLLLSTFFLKIGLNRTDSSHFLYGYWPQLLIMGYLLKDDVLGINVSNAKLTLLNKHLYTIIILFFLFFVANNTNVLNNSGYKYRETVKKLFNPPKNEEIVSDGILWVANTIKDSQATTVFDFTNQGVINGLTQLPTTTNFGYIVYCNQSYEDEIISYLIEKKPNSLVFFSEFWSFSIDGRSMYDRFPQVTRYIKDNYQQYSENYGYIVRYLNE